MQKEEHGQIVRQRVALSVAWIDPPCWEVSDRVQDRQVRTVRPYCENCTGVDGRSLGRSASREKIDMKYFMIKYQFKGGSEEEWHREIGRFVAALESDPVLKGKISYRSTKHKGGTDYYHLAAAADEQAVKALEDRDFFSRFKEQTTIASGGGVEVLPLEIIAETGFRA
jgi:hypothetical protein